jgi:1-acyl-sn-glycerol-3-phosphate acyltransferase
VIVSAPPDLPDGTWPWLHDTTRWVGTWLFRPWFRLRVHGGYRVPPVGAVVLVANHSSLIEPQMIYGLIGRRSVFLVKAEIAGGGFIGGALRAIGQLSVRRGSPDRTALGAAIRVLRGGGLVGVFPEGTRGDGDVLRAEQGAAWLVRSTGAVVLPVAVRGTRRPTDRRRRWRPEVDLLFGDPFPLTVHRGRTGLADGTETIRTTLADLVRELDELREARRSKEVRHD